MAWSDELKKKIDELELIASWASMTNMGRVRDRMRLAIAELRAEVERLKREDNP